MMACLTVKMMQNIEIYPYFPHDMRWKKKKNNASTITLWIITLLSKNYWQFSSTILMQFSCNNRWDFQKCPCNSHLQFSSNSHQIILTCNSHPCNSHPIFTWQFSSNFHLTILIQFSPDNSLPILTYNSHSILINTAQSVLTNNAQPIFS